MGFGLLAGVAKNLLESSPDVSVAGIDVPTITEASLSGEEEINSAHLTVNCLARAFPNS